MKVSDVRRLALALPEATEAPHHHLSSFRLQGKIFAAKARDVKALLRAAWERKAPKKLLAKAG